MKKLLAITLIAAMATLVACGGGKNKEKEKNRLDSLKRDSIARVREADSLALVEKEQKKLDSLKQDSITKVEKKKAGAGKHKSTSKKTQPKKKTTHLKAA